MKTNNRFLFTAVFAAITFTFFACSGDDSPPEQPPGGEPNPQYSSSEGSSGLASSSSSAPEILGYCDYGPIQANGDGGCFPMTTDDDAANCSKWGKVVSSCDNKSSSSLLVQNSSSSTQSSSSLAQSSSSVTSRVCKSNDLGKGYDVIGNPYINWTKVNNIAVLDQDKMCQDDILELDKPGGAQQYASFSGNTIKEFYSKRNESMKISANLGVDINIAFVFSAGFDVKFAQKTSSGSSQNSSLKYYYSQIRSYLYTGEDQIKSGSTSAQNLSKYLRNDFISDLKSTKSAGQILDLYGSHVFIHYYKGGSLEANYTYTGSDSDSRFTSASQMELAAKASFGKIDAGIGTSSGESDEQRISELQQHMSFNYETYGGNSIGATNVSGVISEYDNWVISVRNNARTTGIKDFAQSFVSIWDLAQQVEGVSFARINDLRNEFKRRADAHGAKFPLEEDCTPADNNDTHYCANGFLTEYGSVTYSGQTYKTVTIGTQTWMAENLNYYVDGSGCYGHDLANCTKYGRLYEWAMAMALPSSCNTTSCLSQISAKHKGICPTGYHIPNNADWDKLTAYVGEETAGRDLKATVGWALCGSGNSYDYKCEDKYGFAALPGGEYSDSSDDFYNIGSFGYWWSASEYDRFSAYQGGTDYHDQRWYNYPGDKPHGFSVRCLKD
jgi:uncharacterized protein (TIGR02145 family)